MMFFNKNNQKMDFSERVLKRAQNNEPMSDKVKGMFKNETKASLNERFKKAKQTLS
ncbi:hypothetical protein [Vibrio tritonius]|uniref:hypothetical protein n=1 Tax=Vibrio tritonius TaxID=1435069 RepID=UPI0012E39A89|nr:hypothetical protein [Vibrio tritonius]